MIIFYEIREKVFVQENHPHEKDPTIPDGKGVTIEIKQHYLAMALPFCPTSKKQTVFTSNTTGFEVPTEQWTPKMQSIAQDANRGIKGAWKLWSFSVILALFFFSVFSIAKYAEWSTTANIASQQELREHPLKGDILHFIYLDPESSWTAASGQISRVNEDSIFIRMSEQREPVIDFKHEAAKKKLNTSDKMYVGEEKAIRTKSYEEERINFYDRSYELALPSCGLKIVERK